MIGVGSLIRPLQSLKNKLNSFGALTGGSRRGLIQVVNGKRVPPVYFHEGGKIPRVKIIIPGAEEKNLPLRDYYYKPGFLLPCFWQAKDKDTLENQGIQLIYWKGAPFRVLKVETDASVRWRGKERIMVEGIIMRVRLEDKIHCLHSLFRVTTNIGPSILLYECTALLSGITLVQHLGYEKMFNGVSISSDSDDAVTLVSSYLECSKELERKKKWVLAKECDLDKEIIRGVVGDIISAFIHISASNQFPWNSHTKICFEYREGTLLADWCTRNFTYETGFQLAFRDESFDYIAARDEGGSEPYLRLPKYMRENLLELCKVKGDETVDGLLETEATENLGND